MMFITAKVMARVSSYLPFGKKKKVDKKIYRMAATDYRLAYDRSGEIFLCFGACIMLDRKDIDFAYFEECGRTGNTIATVHGSGRIEFAEEEGCDEYVFAEHPEPGSQPHYPRCPNSFRPNTTIVLEIV